MNDGKTLPEFIWGIWDLGFTVAAEVYLAYEPTDLVFVSYKKLFELVVEDEETPWENSANYYGYGYRPMEEADMVGLAANRGFTLAAYTGLI